MDHFNTTLNCGRVTVNYDRKTLQVISVTNLIGEKVELDEYDQQLALEKVIDFESDDL